MDYIKEIPDAVEILTKEAKSELDRRYALTWLDKTVDIKVSHRTFICLPLIVDLQKRPIPQFIFYHLTSTYHAPNRCEKSIETRNWSSCIHCFLILMLAFWE